MDCGLYQAGHEIRTYGCVLIMITIHDKFIFCLVNMINVSETIYNHLRLLGPGEPV